MRQTGSSDPIPETTSRIRSHRRGAALRERVMSETVNELLNVGLDKLTIAQVADRAGVHVTSIYRRWKTKEQLVTDALVDQFDSTINVPDTGSLRGDLIALTIDLHTALTKPQVKTLSRLVAMPIDIGPLVDLQRRMTQARIEVLKSIFVRSAARGDIDISTEPDYRLLLEVIHAPIYARVLLTREPVDPEFIEALVDVLMTGFTPR